MGTKVKPVMTRGRSALQAVPAPGPEEPVSRVATQSVRSSEGKPGQESGLRDSHVGPASLDPDQVFRRYAAYVAATAHRLLGHDEEVDDTVQEVFVVAVRSIHKLRDPEAVRGWLACIAVRVVRRRLRWRRAKRMVGIESGSRPDLVDQSASPEHRTLLLQVFRTLDRLPANDRIAWSLRYLQGERLEDVARQCGCSLATAKRRIAAASRVMEEVLHEA
jgi:RNA polymerase sigma-70 factor (ECF subfamily)